MFCLDYVLAFVFHSAFTVGAVHLSTEWTRKNGGRVTWLHVREDHADLASRTAVTALGLQNQLTSKPMQDSIVARCFRFVLYVHSGEEAIKKPMFRLVEEPRDRGL